jgi:hypothetical protein
MSGNKTVPTNTPVTSFLKGIDDPVQRNDSFRLVELMNEVSGAPAVMWGEHIVGFGTYHYVYQSGREGDILKVGFSPRKGKLALYVGAMTDKNKPLLKKLGKFGNGKSCLYVKRLTDIDENVLRKIISNTYLTFSEDYDK